jgi:hypothetical protein
MAATTSTLKQYSVPGGLIPAEVNARFKRTMGSFPQPQVSGSTVDQEGLANNYVVSPQGSYAEKTGTKTRLWQAVAFAAATWIPVSIAILVS